MIRTYRLIVGFALAVGSLGSFALTPTPTTVPTTCSVTSSAAVYTACINAMNQQSVVNQTATTSTTSSVAPVLPPWAVSDHATGGRLACHILNAACILRVLAQPTCPPNQACTLVAPAPARECYCFRDQFDPRQFQYSYFSAYDWFLHGIVKAILDQARQSGDSRVALLTFIYGGPQLRQAFTQYNAMEQARAATGTGGTGTGTGGTTGSAAQQGWTNFLNGLFGPRG